MTTTPSKREEKVHIVPNTAPPALRKDSMKRAQFLRPSRLNTDLYGISLFVGSYVHSRNRAVLEECGIKAILCVKESCRFQDNYLYEHVALSDFGKTDLIGGQKAIEEETGKRESNVLTPEKSSEGPPALYRCAAFMSRCAGQGSNVLIHCSSGVNRSATVAMGVLMLLKHWTLKQSFECVRNGRPCSSPHERYFKQLQHLDRRLHGGELSLTREEVGPSLQQTVRSLLSANEGDDEMKEETEEGSALTKLKEDLARKELELEKLRSELDSKGERKKGEDDDDVTKRSEAVDERIDRNFDSDLSGATTAEEEEEEEEEDVGLSMDEEVLEASPVVMKTPEKVPTTSNAASPFPFETPLPPPTPESPKRELESVSKLDVDDILLVDSKNDCAVVGSPSDRQLHRASTRGFESLKEESACRCILM